jgi:CRP-like cAMP-binding protein
VERPVLVPFSEQIFSLPADDPSMRQNVFPNENGAEVRKGNTTPTRGSAVGSEVSKNNFSETLLRTALLGGLSREEAITVLNHASVQTRRRGEWLFRQEEPARQIHVLVSGLVRLQKVAGDGHELLIGFRTAGEMLGYSAIAEHSNYVVSAEAFQDSCTMVWRGETIRRLTHQYPRLALNAFGIVLRSLIHSEDRNFYLATKPVTERIARSLSNLAQLMGSRSEEGIVVTLPAKDLAQLAGTTVYSVSRALSAWQRRGILRKDRGRIILFDPDALIRDEHAA